MKYFSEFLLGCEFLKNIWLGYEIYFEHKSVGKVTKQKDH